MSTHSTVSSTLSSQVIFVFFLTAALAHAQVRPSGSTNDRARGIELLANGDTIGALILLRAVAEQDKNDLVAWHWIGLALERQGKLDDARKAHERAAKLGEALLMSQVNASGVDDFSFVVSKLKPQLALAANSSDAYIRLSQKLSRSKAREWSERSQFLHDYERFPEANELTIYSGKEVTTKVRVLEKREPAYTEEARQHQITGTIVLRAIFAEDGRVRSIIPLTRLPYGLTAGAIKVAREIKFVPATKDGRPVSMWMELEYHFNLY
jgi:TonB family protein